MKMKGIPKRRSRRTGLGLAVGVFLIVVVWRLVVIASQNHLLAVANEAGSVPQFRERLSTSSDGASLVYFRETENGLGTYFCDAASGTSRLLYEQREFGFNGYLGTVAWSPDNLLLACAFKNDNDPRNPKREIDIFDGRSGQKMFKLDAIWESRFIWLSPRSFAYSRYNGAWLMFERGADGGWVQTRVVNKFGKDDYLDNLVATSPHSVAWKQDNEVWTRDLLTGEEAMIWPSTNTLFGFTYNADKGDFLLNCANERGPVTLLLRPPHFGEKFGAIIDSNPITNRPASALLQIVTGVYTFSIWTGKDPEPIQFDWDGMVEDFKLAGNFLYFVGNRANETPAVWQYDLRDAKVRCLAPNPIDGFRFAKVVSPVIGTATTPQGRKISFHLWKPKALVGGKKYPLIIGQTHYVWNPYQQIAPEAGYYYATVDRATWADNIDNWPEDVMTLHDLLAKEPGIDTNRVYLSAFSAEALDVVQVLAVRPDICKGVILFNPSAMPDLSNAKFSRLLVFGGKDDDAGIPVAQLEESQDTLAKAGVQVTLIIQEGAQHVARSVATERERARQFAKFLMEN